MKNNEQNQNTAKANDEVKAIKDDMYDLAKRLKSLKGNAIDILSHDMEGFMSTLTDLKDKTLDEGREKIKWMSHCVEKHPCQSMLWAFGGGILCALLLFRK